MLRIKIGLGIVVGILSLPSFAQQGAYADEDPKAQAMLGSYIEIYRQAECDYLGQDAGEFQTSLCTTLEDYIVALLGDQISNIEEKNNVILLTNISANITFVLAHLFLFIGCYLAFKEIRHANALRASGTEQSLELKVGLEGIALKTSFLGFGILALALGFYFLYLKFVYPIIVI